MRFRLIEKDGGGMANVGLKDQHIQGKEDDVTTSDSKTYIGSKGKQKLAMNKIKNTKIGDDIHYYINGLEGRGIVVKMANEYLEIFKEDGQLGTIHINDTFFVKDILINKQWDDMDDTERYEALRKIHAPSPRYITKTWFDMPEEIKVLLRKQMPGGTGSTFEQGETKDSETQDHARTGFAQNEQYSSKKPKGCKCGDPKCKDPKCKKHTDVKKADDKEEEHRLRRRREHGEKRSNEMSAGNPDYYTTKNPKWRGDESKIPRPLVTTNFKTGKETLNPGRQKGYWHTNERKLRHARRQFHKDDPDRAKEWEEAYQDYDRKESLADAARSIDARSGKPSIGQRDTPTPKKDPPTHSTSSDSCPTCGNKHPGLVHEKKPDDDDSDWENPMAAQKSFYKQWLEKKVKRPSPRTAHGSFGTTQSAEGQEAQQSFSDTTTSAASAIGADFGTATTKTHSGNLDSRPSTSGNPPKTISGDEKRRRERHQDEEVEKSRAFGKLKPVYEGDTKEAKDTKKAYEVWLERQQKSVSDLPVSGDRSFDSGGQAKPIHNITTNPKTGNKVMEVSEGVLETRGGKQYRGNQQSKEGQALRARVADGDSDRPRSDDSKVDDARLRKSDVEHGKLGNVGSTPEVAVSTDTKVDVTTGTGYEERPHISVEEAGKLPRGTFNESGSELTVSGSQDSKDEPKFS